MHPYAATLGIAIELFDMITKVGRRQRDFSHLIQQAIPPQADDPRMQIRPPTWGHPRWGANSTESPGSSALRSKKIVSGLETFGLCDGLIAEKASRILKNQTKIWK